MCSLHRKANANQGLVGKYALMMPFVTMPISSITAEKANILPTIMETHLCSLDCCTVNIKVSACEPHSVVLDSISLNNSRNKPVSCIFRGSSASVLELNLLDRLPDGTNRLTSSYFHLAKFALSCGLTPSEAVPSS